MSKRFNCYINHHGRLIGYYMNSDRDTPTRRCSMDSSLDYTMHECNMRECICFNTCNRIYIQPTGNEDKRKCIEYRHINKRTHV